MNTTLHSVTIRRSLPASKKTVFAAFESAEKMRKWFSPSPDITLGIKEYDFKVGGTYCIEYLMQDGSGPVLRGKFLHIVPFERLTFTWYWDEEDPLANAKTTVNISFDEVENSTELTITHSDIPTEEIAKRHIPGWETTLDQLAAGSLLSS